MMKLRLVLAFTLFALTEGKDCSLGCYEQSGSGQAESCNCCDRDNPPANPCAATSCLTGYACVPRPKPCMDAQGFNINCPFTLEGQCRKNCGKVASCGEGCHQVYDADGCKACYCNKSFINPCKSDYKGCNMDQECVLQSNSDCGSQSCEPFPICKKICQPLDTCPSTCVKYIDSEGCEACHCCNACVKKKCNAGEKCRLQVVQCFAPPCNPLAQCVAK